MPRHTRRAGNSPEISSPSKMTWPEVCVRKPLIRLKKVVLPAPFGPITARSSPGSTVIDTLSTATRLPKCFETFSTRNRLTMSPFSRCRLSPDDAQNAAREEQHDEHEEQADERHPVLRLARNVVLQHQKDRRADQRPPEAAHAAQHRHDDEIAGLVPAQRAGIDEVVHQREQRAGDADEETGDDPRHPDVLVDRNAEKARTALVLADRQQRAAERRAQQERHGGCRNREGRQHEIIERLVAVEDIESGKAEIKRLAMPGADAVVAAGEREPLKGDEKKHLPESNGAHGEIDAAQPHDHRADDGGSDGAEHDAGEHADRRRGYQIFDGQGGAVGTQPEIGGVAERQHAGIAKQEIERHGGERVDHHAGAELDIAAGQRQPERRRQEHRPDQNVAGALVEFRHQKRPSSPSRPRGRTIKTAAIMTYMTASLAAGRNTVVTPETTPIRMPPTSVPGNEPRPPTMMAMKLGMIRLSPIVGCNPSRPTASTPASPAR